MGITNATPLVIQQEMNPALRCPQSSCNLVFEKQTLTRAGGSAFDGRLPGLGISNGRDLTCIDSSSCKLLCPTAKIPLPPVGAGVKVWCTGLAFVDSGALGSTAAAPGWLFASYNTGHIGRLRDTTAQFCKLSVTGVTIGGLATDDVKRLLFIGTVSSTGANVIHVARIDPTVASPQPWCSPFCSFPAPTCTSTSKLGPITGLAHDSCRNMLFITDGKQTTYGVVTAGATSCSIQHVDCCLLGSNAAGDSFTGLCVQPDPTESLGTSCALSGCQGCGPVMRAALTGAAVLGNPSFGFELRNAPSNTTALAFAANVGACSSPGLSLGFCAPVRVPFGPAPPLVLIFGVPGSVGTCNFNVRLPTGLPLDRELCGFTFSFQWVIGCTGIPNNFGVTNCISFRVSGS